MTLLDLISKLETLNNDETIYVAQPWQCQSTALVTMETADGKLPAIAIQYKLSYFLEVSIAKQFMEDWISGLNFKPSDEEKCSRLIHYATFDA